MTIRATEAARAVATTSMRTRLFVVGLASLVWIAALPTLAATIDGGSPCAVPRLLRQRTEHGYRPDRAGNIQLLTAEPDFVGQGGLPHSGPWDYVSKVPLVWYGPGHVPSIGRVNRRVTLADVAPTQASYLKFAFEAPDGDALAEIEPPTEADPPKVAILLVWDAAGQGVLSAWPRAWPTLRSLMERGTWYANAEVGSSPPSTAQIHATLGTGAFSRTHGITAHHFLVGDAIARPWETGPTFLTLPTLADVYDEALDNAPIVGAVAAVDIQLGMVGRGRAWNGGDADPIAVRERHVAAETGPGWELTPNIDDLYRDAAYLNELPPVSTYLRTADRADGKLDGTWRGHRLNDPTLESGFDTPARAPFQTAAIEAFIERERFGTDDVPDLLFLNYKLLDEVAHRYGPESLEMRDAIRAQDAALGELVALFDERFGAGEWVLALTADHGATPDPTTTGAVGISPSRVGSAIRSAFDRDGDGVDVVRFVQPTQIHVDEEELREQGATVDDVAAFLRGLTKGAVADPKWPPSVADASDPAFLTAFPSRLLGTTSCG